MTEADVGKFMVWENTDDVYKIESFYNEPVIVLKNIKTGEKNTIPASLYRYKELILLARDPGQA